MERALAFQNHRGPDSQQLCMLQSMILGHNRLSIIDTHERSNQPFADDSGRYHMVFNGEIYNYQELKNELLGKGIRFETSSDTEVLFRLLIEQGRESLERLRGCFSIAFYDRDEDYLLLARDRMGINPLLYAFEEDRLIFASELDIFTELGVGQTLSQQAINYYFQYTYIPAPFTIYEEVQKLPPGHFLELKGSHIRVESYWSLDAGAKYEGSFEQACKDLREKLEYGVISQLEADVPIGTFLSGGIDSSLVSAIAARQKDELYTFSVSFGDQQSFDESHYALEVAKHIQSRHHVVRLQEQDFRTSFQDILDAYDEPFADSSAIAMWFLSRETRKHLTVALSGDGADELLGGYRKHMAFQKAQSYSPFKKSMLQFAASGIHPILKKIKPGKANQLKKMLALMESSWPSNYWLLASNIGEEQKGELLSNSFSSNPIYGREYRDFNDFLLFDQEFVLPNDMLKKVDLMSMAHSLEVRTPFLDKDLVHFANSLPPEWKIHQGKGKYILKEAFTEYLPQSIYTRKKQGFEVPLNAWIRKNWKELVPEQWFEEDFLREQGIFEVAAVHKMRTSFFQNQGTSNQLMWAYFVFQNWYLKKFRHA